LRQEKFNTVGTESTEDGEKIREVQITSRECGEIEAGLRRNSGVKPPHSKMAMGLEKDGRGRYNAWDL